MNYPTYQEDKQFLSNNYSEIHPLIHRMLVEEGEASSWSTNNPVDIDLNRTGSSLSASAKSSRVQLASAKVCREFSSSCEVLAVVRMNKSRFLWKFLLFTTKNNTEPTHLPTSETFLHIPSSFILKMMHSELISSTNQLMDESLRNSSNHDDNNYTTKSPNQSNGEFPILPTSTYEDGEDLNQTQISNGSSTSASSTWDYDNYIEKPRGKAIYS